MAGAAHSQQEAQGDSRPASSLCNPEEEGPGSLWASVWLRSLWASLGHPPAPVLPALVSRWNPPERGVTKKHGWGLGSKPGMVGWRPALQVVPLAAPLVSQTRRVQSISPEHCPPRLL